MDALASGAARAAPLATAALPSSARRAARVPLPRIWPVAAPDVVWVLGRNAALILAMWIRHDPLLVAIEPGSAAEPSFSRSSQESAVSFGA